MAEEIKTAGLLFAATALYMAVILHLAIKFARPEPTEARDTPKPVTAFTAESTAHYRQRLAYVARRVDAQDKVLAMARQMELSRRERQEFLAERARQMGGAQ